MVYFRQAYISKKMVYYRWGYRYPCFLRSLKNLFMSLQNRHKEWYREFGDMGNFRVIVNSKKIEPKYVWKNNQEKYPTIICGIPDGEYLVENAAHENGKAYYITVTEGAFEDKDITMAGAYVCWCVQSNNPTGHTTVHLDTEEDYSRYHEGLCGELYHCHNLVDKVEFNLEKKTVCLETSACFDL